MGFSVLQRDEASRIMYREESVDDPCAVLVLVHGLGAHSAWWRSLVDYCAHHSMAALAIELRGFGETTDMRGHIDSFSTYFSDVRTLVQLARMRYPGKKVFLVGESMGGLIAFIAASFRPALCDGLICLSPAFKGKALFSFFQQMRILGTLLYARRKPFDFPFTPEMCTRDPEWQRAIYDDVRTVRAASAQLLANIGIQQICAHMVRKEVVVPSLFLLAGKDAIIDSKVSKKIFSDLPNDDKLLIEYTLMYHSLSVDLEKEQMFHDLVQWVQKHITI